ncbi:hypothetical protein D9619_008923 [Psilocybe cf. subviscida]|uniref:Uncharacterized protein n=1 Tax=Psilocybe cf. subviscida TaxID=2480587 RepID=A0A8H5FAM8_9AGAR|nr:hypothetical protein D9619_008923 [Psilocybe cf. subviscida]
MSTGTGAIRRNDQYWRERLAPTVYGRLIQIPAIWHSMSDGGRRQDGAPDLEAAEPNNTGDSGKHGHVNDAHRGSLRSASTPTSNSTSPHPQPQISFPRFEPTLGIVSDCGDTAGEPPSRRTLGAARPVSVPPARRISPDHYKRSTSSSAKQRLNRVPEEMESTAAGPATFEGDTNRYYGSMSQRMPQVSSPVQEESNRFDISYDEDSDISEEEEEWLLDEELAKQGLYRGNLALILQMKRIHSRLSSGNMKNLFLLYSLVPLSAGIAFILLALIPAFVLPHKTQSLYPYPPYLPYPLPEVFTTVALWSLSYLLRDFLYGVALFVTSWVLQRLPKFIPVVASALSAILQSASTLFLRQLAVPILLVPYYSTHPTIGPGGGVNTADVLFAHRKNHYPTWQDDAFRRVWWIALGWAAAEAIVGIKQGYENIALYREVLVNVSKNSGKAGLMSKTPINGGGLAPGRSPIPRALAQTNHSRREAMTDVDATPTQRDGQDRNLSIDTVERTIRPPVQRSGYSDSLSTMSNSCRGSMYEPLETSQTVGETRPLLAPHIQTSTILRYDHISERILADNEIERDLDQLAALKSREDLEEIYGIPFIDQLDPDLPGVMPPPHVSVHALVIRVPPFNTSVVGGSGQRPVSPLK